jgi:DNA polymerase-3 subunit delta'
LLFVGARGVGKATTARALAQALLCTAAPGRGCGACEACGKVERGVHPDVTWMVPEGPGNTIRIEAVRDLIRALALPPHEGAARVVILDGADTLRTEGANALLKTLEEPPARTHFVLVTAAPEKLPITVRSRCRRVRFVPLRDEAIRDLLVARGRALEAAGVAALLAQGSLGRALELAAGDATRRSEVAAELRRGVGRGPVAASAVAAGAGEDREELGEVLLVLQLFYLEVLRVQENLAPAASADAVEAAARLSRTSILANSQAIAQAAVALAGNVHPQLVLERMLLRLRAS